MAEDDLLRRRRRPGTGALSGRFASAENGGLLGWVHHTRRAGSGCERWKLGYGKLCPKIFLDIDRTFLQVSGMGPLRFWDIHDTKNFGYQLHVERRLFRTWVPLKKKPCRARTGDGSHEMTLETIEWYEMGRGEAEPINYIIYFTILCGIDGFCPD